MADRILPPRHCEICGEADVKKLVEEWECAFLCLECDRKLTGENPAIVLSDEEWNRIRQMAFDWERSCFETKQPKTDPRKVIAYAERIIGVERGTVEPVLESDEWWFVPTGYIGSHGLIIDKNCNEFSFCGSIGMTFSYLNSYDKGNRDELLDLEITSVTDESEAVKILDSIPLLHNTGAECGPMSLKRWSAAAVRQWIQDLPAKTWRQPFLKGTPWIDKKFNQENHIELPFDFEVTRTSKG